MTTISKWHRFETSIELDVSTDTDPIRDVLAEAIFTAPDGRSLPVPAFWDGGRTWRARFAPHIEGTWRYAWRVRAGSGGQGVRGTASHARPATPADQLGVQGSAASPAGGAPAGTFQCVPYTGTNPFYLHGPIRTSPDAPHLIHADGTPFFFLADTVWNGPMLSTPEDWAHYVQTRQQQKFTAAQYVSTQWRTAPDGGPHGPAYEGGDHLTRINPTFFQHLDQKLDLLTEHGIAGVPVLLWAIKGGANKETNPGNVLSEGDCALLAGYQVARWHAHPVLFILNGDGKYLDGEAARWRRIGRTVFGHTRRHERPPTIVHPGGQTWVGHEFRDEGWLDVVGYQSGHGDDEKAWRWIVQGPPATEWASVPGKVVMNIESPYEDHLSYQSKERHPAVHVRRANYWSLMVSPTAGVTYGGHGIWGWDDGTAPPVAHPNTGVPKHWREALHLPGAEQMTHLYDAFASLPWWQLRPAKELLAAQPGEAEVLRYITAARAEDGSCAILYLAGGGEVALDTTALRDSLRATWLNPRNGARTEAGTVQRGRVTLTAPDTADWVLLFT